MFGRQSFDGLTAYFQSLVHDAARSDPLVAARHQSFIGSHVIAGVASLCVFPIYLVIVGKPTLLSAIAFAWFISPLGVAIFLSRTGRLHAAHCISAANLAGLITFACWITGGLSSFLLPWMIVIPFEAGLSASRRAVIWSAALAALCLSLLGLGGMLGLVLEARALPLGPGALSLLGAMSAAFYAAGLSVSIQVVHQRSAEAVRHGERRYRLLAENATDMLTHHDEQGKVAFASFAAENLLGEPAGTLSGDGLFERVHVADRPLYLSALSRCLQNSEPVAAEFRLRRKMPTSATGGMAVDGFIWAEMRCRPIDIETRVDDATDPRPAAVVAVTRDISDRKAQEAEILKARDEAEGASRAKTQFLASVSHELRTPLNAIIGFSEILARELFGALGDRYRDYARLIHESGEHLLQVVNDILDMSKIEAGKFTILTDPFDFGTLTRSCCEIMRHGAEKKSIMLEVDLPQGMPEVVGDKRACKQMLLNLLSNAIKFTPAGGWVRVALRSRGEMIVLSVADNGIGIAEEELPRLGNPFVQADTSYNRRHDGTGLGLSMVKGLTRLHGGSFQIESELGHGTTVTIGLPFESAKDSSEGANEIEPRQLLSA